MRRLAILAALALSACSTMGRPIRWDEAATLRRGESTSTEALAKLGPAEKVEAGLDGGLVYTWWHWQGNPFGSSSDSLVLAFDRDGKLASEPPGGRPVR